jgi:hypothetical protein
MSNSRRASSIHGARYPLSPAHATGQAIGSPRPRSTPRPLRQAVHPASPGASRLTPDDPTPRASACTAAGWGAWCPTHRHTASAPVEDVHRKRPTPSGARRTPTTTQRLINIMGLDVRHAPMTDHVVGEQVFIEGPDRRVERAFPIHLGLVVPQGRAAQLRSSSRSW